MKVSSPSHKGIEPVRDEKTEEREKKRRGQFGIFQGKPSGFRGCLALEHGTTAQHSFHPGRGSNPLFLTKTST